MSHVCWCIWLGGIKAPNPAQLFVIAMGNKLMSSANRYISELLYGDFANYSEDRFSQIFSATFNNSVQFQNAFLDYIGVKKKGELTAETQFACWVNNEISKLDILIKENGKPIIVIESKIEAPLTKKQLQQYNNISKINQCLKICFVKYYQNESKLSRKWRVLYWRNFYSYLTVKKTLLDDIIALNFIYALEDFEMEHPANIKEMDIRKLVQVLYVIRNREKPEMGDIGNVFRTMNHVQNMLEDIFRKAAKRTILTKRVGKNFRAKMKISYWQEEEKSDHLIYFCCYTKLSKPYNKYDHIGVGLFLHKNERDYDLEAYVQEVGTKNLKLFTYPKQDVNCLEFEDKAIKFWESKLK
jgi:nitrate reductase NapAB chaperone NapD